MDHQGLFWPLIGTIPPRRSLQALPLASRKAGVCLKLAEVARPYALQRELGEEEQRHLAQAAPAEPELGWLMNAHHGKVSVLLLH